MASPGSGVLVVPGVLMAFLPAVAFVPVLAFVPVRVVVVLLPAGCSCLRRIPSRTTPIRPTSSRIAPVGVRAGRSPALT
ncbi:hypothetical protein ACU686_18095 [Yinghuangia aomiensis]